MGKFLRPSELAARWQCEESDVVALIQLGWLRACDFSTGTRPRYWVQADDLPAVMPHSYEVKLYKSEARKAKDRDKYRRKKRLHPEQIKARQVVRAAVFCGMIPNVKTLTCRHCLGDACAFHHYSYAPQHHLDVVPLCTSCHAREHNRLKRVGKPKLGKRRKPIRKSDVVEFIK